MIHKSNVERKIKMSNIRDFIYVAEACVADSDGSAWPVAEEVSDDEGLDLPTAVAKGGSFPVASIDKEESERQSILREAKERSREIIGGMVERLALKGAGSSTRFEAPWSHEVICATVGILLDEFRTPSHRFQLDRRGENEWEIKCFARDRLQ